MKIMNYQNSEQYEQRKKLGALFIKEQFHLFFPAENSATVEPILEKAAGSIPKGISAESDSQSENTDNAFNYNGFS